MITFQRSNGAGYRDRLVQAESDEIRRYRQQLSREVGCQVSLEHAAYDWETRHSARWRREQLKRELEAQMQEMMKHKWIESEKAGTDLGDAAVKDWIHKYAARWRQEYAL